MEIVTPVYIKTAKLGSMGSSEGECSKTLMLKTAFYFGIVDDILFTV